MTNYVDGKVVVITGAGGGFGRRVAELTAALGAKVVGIDISAEGLETSARTIRAEGGTFEPYVGDVTDRHQVGAAAAHAVDRFGCVDVLVNNAGIMPLAFYADHQSAWQAWDKCIDINIKGVLHDIAAVYDQMISQGRGHVVNVSSISGNFPLREARYTEPPRPPSTCSLSPCGSRRRARSRSRLSGRPGYPRPASATA